MELSDKIFVSLALLGLCFLLLKNYTAKTKPTFENNPLIKLSLSFYPVILLLLLSVFSLTQMGLGGIGFLSASSGLMIIIAFEFFERWKKH